MKDFFHGWRRKVGVVTLVMACSFNCLWLRSLSQMDQLVLNFILPHSTFQSFNGAMKVYSTHTHHSESIWEHIEIGFFHPLSDDDGWQVELITGGGAYLIGYADAWRVQYWSIIALLALLSAYLLLSKPRQPTQSADITEGSESAPRSGDPPRA